MPGMQTSSATRPSRTADGLAVTRLTRHIGAEVHGIDLRAELAGTLDPSLVAALRTAVAEHHVIMLRDQHLTAEQHARLARAFGEIQPSPVHLAIGRDATPTVSTIEDTAARPPAGFPWHTDVSWVAAPPELGFLSAVVIPEVGGDTLWASTAAIHDALPEELRRRCGECVVLHAPDPSLLASVERHHGAAAAARLRARHPGTLHPLVRTDPLTGRRSLYLCPLSARRLLGPDGTEDATLLARLHGMLDDPHVQVRWRWRAGDLVIWDEAATCHRALTDHFPQRRVMRRCVTASRSTGGGRPRIIGT